MRLLFLHRCLAVLLLGYLGSPLTGRAQPRPVPTPQTARPWTYWWWMGSAVSERGITEQLTQFAAAGLGGVHIIPIYGAKGAETAFVPFLSPRWMALFQHTVREGKRLGLGVDLTTGTGWPFGGPTITPDRAAKRWERAGDSLRAVLTRQAVKRAAPGGEGLVLDPFSAEALRGYLARFDSAFAGVPERPRSFYNDSYEAYGANWTARFPEEFRRRRGYDLRTQLRHFLDTAQTETAIRVRMDVQETLSDLLLDEFTRPWADWARQRGTLTRNQAHGSPGNLLDLYAGADIPETESFGSSRFPIPGLRVDENYEVDRFGTPHPLAMKFASSAAHLTGKPLVSSETGTWLADHFKVSLSQLKPQIDELFAAGINHVFFHGITYTPPETPWPGWLFYASTNYGPSSHFWPHLPGLTRYIERCQRRLQAAQPDHAALLYFPMHDLWAQPAKSAGGLHQLEVHHVDRWLLKLPVGQAGEFLLRQGVGFDYVSDRQLAALQPGTGGTLRAAGGTYRLVVVPPLRYLPEATARHLLALARQGVPVWFIDQTPTDAPGFHEAADRSARVRAYADSLRREPSVRVGAAGPEGVRWLAQHGGRPEAFVPRTGLSFLRKRQGDSTVYFVTNLTARAATDSVRLVGEPERLRVLRYDPLHDQTVELPRRGAHVGFSLQPGESLFLTIFPGPARSIPAAAPLVSRPLTYSLAGTWQLDFPAGAPHRPAPQTLPALRSWVLPGDTTTGWFSGSGRYRLRFAAPDSVRRRTDLVLDLGDVREVAEVWLNGQPLGVAWCLPFRMRVPAGILRAQNTLEVRVTNLSANRARYLDAKKISWKTFYDINLVDIRYRPFDATLGGPVPSGLLGPVRLLTP
jgi:hypothetical protein